MGKIVLLLMFLYIMYIGNTASEIKNVLKLPSNEDEITQNLAKQISTTLVSYKEKGKIQFMQ